MCVKEIVIVCILNFDRGRLKALNEVELLNGVRQGCSLGEELFD